MSVMAITMFICFVLNLYTHDLRLLFWCFFQSIGGSIMAACPTSDLNPLFVSAKCKVTVANKGMLCSLIEQETYKKFSMNTDLLCTLF